MITVSISYKTEEMIGYNDLLDELLIKIAGEPISEGSGFFARDMQWDCDSEEEANSLKDKFKDIKDVTVDILQREDQ